MQDDRYLTKHECAARYHISVRTLERWREIGEGPRYVRIGPRKIVYRLSDCEEWATANTFASNQAETEEPAEVSSVSAGPTMTGSGQTASYPILHFRREA